MPLKKLVVLCDGTWCGRDTRTQSNIYRIATMIGIPMTNDRYSIGGPGSRVVGRYFEGVGMDGTFLEYLYDGATASDIGTECTDVYKYIVENYTREHEIWMFGLSRGSFTVRSVAGMINNCGIITRREKTEETDALCDEVYRIYRSPYDHDKPDSPHMVRFKDRACYPVKTPIKFMGILDTVGGLGIPILNAGVGFDWPQFHDQKISSAVEKVYHAVSMHDRLWIFQPCLAFRDPKHVGNEDLVIHEKWFPGTHYDLGRQKFKFMRAGRNRAERALFWLPNMLSQTVRPNEILSDLVLKWMLESIRNEDPSGHVIGNIGTPIEDLIDNMKSGHPDVGTGDMYRSVMDYVPFGFFLKTVGWMARKLLPNAAGAAGKAVGDALGITFAMDTLLHVEDRRIPGATAETYHYKEHDPLISAKIVDVAAMSSTRYPSQTYEACQLYLLAAEEIVPATFDARVDLQRMYMNNRL